MTETTRDARLKGNWEQMQGRVKEAWGALTDDDTQRASGSWDRLVGVVRERTGESLESVETKLNEMLDKAEAAGEPSRGDETR